MPKQRLISYAQYQEDLMLFSLLHEIGQGFYVDVGASDPIIMSVTKLFYDLGWRGINIEPLPSLYDRLCQMRPNDINLCIGAGSQIETLPLLIDGWDSKFIMIDESSFDESNNKTASNYGFASSRMTPIYPLTHVLPEYIDIKSQMIHFCKIDAQGLENLVLEGLNFNIIRPWVLSIKAALPHSMALSFDAWEPMLLNNGYNFIGSVFTSRYYVDYDHMDLVARSLSGEMMTREYDIIIENPLKYAQPMEYAT